MRQEAFGGRARLATLLMQVHDATTGNKDGVIGNERLAANVVAKNPLSPHPLPFRIARSLSVGFDKRPQERALSTFLAEFEAGRGGLPTTTIARPAHVSPADWAAFSVRKAITCTRFDLSPDALTELIVPARGSVDGVEFAPRDIFVQRYAPRGAWSGTTVVFAPGYGESGRTYAEQAVLATQQGHEVYVLDQPWLGLSQGVRGQVDRAFGIARDIAAVTAKAANDARLLRPDAKVVLAGTSLGGMGSYVAIRMNELGRVQLDGPQMPRDVAAVLHSPFFAIHPRLDTLTRVVCRMTWLANLPLPRITASPVTDDPVTAQKLVAHSIVERINARLHPLHVTDDDVARLADLELANELERHGAPGTAPIYVVHAARDPLASHAAAAEWVARMGARARMVTLDSMNHATAENPLQQGFVLDGIAWVTGAHG